MKTNIFQKTIFIFVLIGIVSSSSFVSMIPSSSTTAVVFAQLHPGFKPVYKNENTSIPRMNQNMSSMEDCILWDNQSNMCTIKTPKLTEQQKKYNECWMYGLPHQEDLNKYDSLGKMYNTTSCEIQYKETQVVETPGMYCKEVSNIDNYIALSEERTGGCDVVIKTDYPDHERYGYTNFGDSKSIYLRPK